MKRTVVTPWKRVPWILAVLAGAGCVESKAPRIVGDARGAKLELPPPMARALEQAVPGFRPWMLESYAPEVLEAGSWKYEFNGRQAPFAIVGDLDADGRPDAIVEGRDSLEVYTLCIWNRTAMRAEVQVLERGRPERWEWVSTARIHFLLHHPAGSMSTGPEPYDPTLVLRGEGFESVVFEKAAVLTYFEDGVFKQVVTAD